jgi:hypothetical protein
MKGAICTMVPDQGGILKVIMLTSIVLALAYSCSAQLPEAPSALRHGPTLPHPEVRERVLDRSYLLWMGIAAGATFADAFSTHRCLSQGRQETSILYGSHPSDARLYGESVGVFAAYAIVTYIVKRRIQVRGESPSWAWQLVPGIFSGAHAIGTAVNGQCL